MFNTPASLPPHIALALQGDRAQDQYLAQSDLQALELYVNSFRQAVEVTPADDPQQLSILNDFGVALIIRFERLGSRADLDESIDIRQIVNALTPEDSSRKPSSLANLAVSIMHRFTLDGDPHDLEEAISLQTQVVNMTPEDDEHRHGRMGNLSMYLHANFERTGDPEYLTKAIALQRQAVDLIPEHHPAKHLWLSNLSTLLVKHFHLEGSIEDLEQAITLQTQAVRLTPDFHPDKPTRIGSLGAKLQERFERLGNMEDLQSAITSYEHALAVTPDGLPDKHALFGNLAGGLVRRFERTMNLEDLRKAIGCQSKAVDLLSDNHSDKPAQLNNLGGKLLELFQHSGSLHVLDQAITAGSKAVELTPDDHSRKPFRFYNLARSSYRRFDHARTDNVADLTEAIKCSTQSVILSPSGHPFRATFLLFLGQLYHIRMSSPHVQPEDLKHAMEAYSEAMQQVFSPPRERLHAGHLYTQLFTTASADSELIPSLPLSLLQAHQLIIDIIPQAAWLGNSINRRFEQLLEYGALASRAAADAIAAEKYTLALEWLEAARSIVWSQVLCLHTPLDDLQHLYPALANKLSHISQALQRTIDMSSAKSNSPLSSLDLHYTHVPLETEAQSSHSYAAQFQKLIEQIRELDDFHDFLCPTKLSHLAPACISGPVVIINADESRCDALVLSGSGDITHVPLHGLKYEHAVKLQTQLKECLRANHVLNRFREIFQNREKDRAGRTSRKGADDQMIEILADLWRLVVKPILDVVLDLTPVSCVLHLGKADVNVFIGSKQSCAYYLVPYWSINLSSPPCRRNIFQTPQL